MTGISFRVRFEGAEGRAELERLIDRMEDREGFFKNVGEHFLNRVHDSFENEQDPEGSPWQRLSPVTVSNRLRRYGNAPLTILRVSGELAGSYNYETGSDEVRIGSGKVQAAIQHFGGQAGRGGKVTIPARPAVGMAAEDEEAIFDMAQDWLEVQ